MHIYRTDLNLLVIFDCIYSQGSVTRAAEVLHLTQPTVSHSLSRLRDRIGDPLFVRNGQRLVPTATAHKLIHPVRQALQLLETSLADLEGFDPASANNRFTVGIRPLMESAFFLPLVQKTSRLAPGISLSSVQLNRENIEAELTSGNLSLAIDVFLSLSNNIHRQHLASDRIVVITRKGHPAITADGISIENYLAQQHLLVSSRPTGHGIEDLMLAREGKSRQVVARCQQIITALELVRDSDLLLTVAETYVNRFYRDDLYQICLAPFSAPKVDTFLYWHISSEADKGNQWLRNMIVESWQSFATNL
jgi:DNA-binding transcriptional LysR family regulator